MTIPFPITVKGYIHTISPTTNRRATVFCLYFFCVFRKFYHDFMHKQAKRVSWHTCCGWQPICSDHYVAVCYTTKIRCLHKKGIKTKPLIFETISTREPKTGTCQLSIGYSNTQSLWNSISIYILYIKLNVILYSFEW